MEYLPAVVRFFKGLKYILYCLARFTLTGGRYCCVFMRRSEQNYIGRLFRLLPRVPPIDTLGITVLLSYFVKLRLNHCQYHLKPDVT